MIASQEQLIPESPTRRRKLSKADAITMEQIHKDLRSAIMAAMLAAAKSEKNKSK